MDKKAVILINVGTPESPGRKHVRKYLTEFLNDRRVIDIPWLARKILVNLIIIPFRTGKSAALYQRLWTQAGSPLRIHLENLVKKLNAQGGEEYRFFGAMRYGSPSIKEILARVMDENFTQIILFPLYPQYASSTTGTVVGEALNIVRSKEVIPEIKTIVQFYDRQAYIDAFAARVREHDLSEYDHVLFSFHGLPERQIRKVHPGTGPGDCTCETSMPSHGRYCYKATCYETTRLIAERLGLPRERYTVAFQSRLSRNWLSPFSDDKVRDFAAKGMKNVLVVAPSFVADCLETTMEIGEDYRDLFLQLGGEKLTLVESLNDSDEWARAIGEMVQASSHASPR